MNGSFHHHKRPSSILKGHRRALSIFALITIWACRWVKKLIKLDENLSINFQPFFFSLQNNKEVVEYSKQILEKYGSGLSSVRFICGTQTIHKVTRQSMIFLYD